MLQKSAENGFCCILDWHCGGSFPLIKQGKAMDPAKFIHLLGFKIVMSFLRHVLVVKNRL